MSPYISRRAFVSGLALSAAAAGAARGLELPGHSSHIAFIGYESPEDPQHGHITMYRVVAGQWMNTGVAVNAVRPRALAVHPLLPILYVAHGVTEHQHLPRGSVSAYRFDTARHKIELLSHQPLALSATSPERLSISADGSLLMAAAPGGSAWNLFHLDPGGSIFPTPSSIKLTGRGPHPQQTSARPRSAVFSSSNAVAYASDFGSDHIDLISLRNDAPVIAHRHKVVEGSGPSDLYLHPSGQVLVAAHRLQPAFSIFRVHSDGQLEEANTYPLETAIAGPAAFRKHGSACYLVHQDASSTTRLSVFALSLENAGIDKVQEMALPGSALPAHLIAMDHELVMLSSEDVTSIPIRAQDGLLIESNSYRRLKTQHAVSMAVIPA